MSAEKISGVGRGMNKWKREESKENGKIDLIYEFSVTFGTDLHFCQISLTSEASVAN